MPKPTSWSSSEPSASTPSTPGRFAMPACSSRWATSTFNSATGSRWVRTLDSSSCTNEPHAMLGVQGRLLLLACALALGACGRDEAPKVAAEPRVVAARGDLAADEASAIELFERSKDAVVYISITQRVVDPWSRNMFSIPRGTGSGFVWDRDGHVVTNNHVIM